MKSLAISQLSLVRAPTRFLYNFRHSAFLCSLYPTSLMVTEWLQQCWVLHSYITLSKKKKRSTFLFHLLKTKSLTSLALDQARCWDHGWASHSAGRMLCADWFMLLSLTPEAGEVVVMLTEALITIHGCCTMRTISTFTHRNQDMIPCALALNALIQLSFPNCTEVWWDVCQG